MGNLLYFISFHFISFHFKHCLAPIARKVRVKLLRRGFVVGFVLNGIERGFLFAWCAWLMFLLRKLADHKKCFIIIPNPTSVRNPWEEFVRRFINPTNGFARISLGKVSIYSDQ